MGGTHAITHALQRAFSSMGGEFVVETPVQSAIIENGKAVGVRLADGREIAARESGGERLEHPSDHSAAHRRGARSSENSPQSQKRPLQDRAQLFWGNVALHELPAVHGSQRQSRDRDVPLGSTGAPRMPDYFATRHQAELFVKGIPDKLVAIVAPDSIWDRTRAPEGKHTILIEQFTAPYRFFSDREWLRMKKDIVKIMLRAMVVVCPQHDQGQRH